MNYANVRAAGCFNRSHGRRSDVVVLACQEHDIFPCPGEVRRAARREGALPDDEVTSYSQGGRFGTLTPVGDASSGPNGVSASSTEPTTDLVASSAANRPTHLLEAPDDR